MTRTANRNQNGQAMGPKGRQTRRRLIDATVSLLAATRLRDLRVGDIAREAGTSPATFYVYFPDVADAVLAALEEVTQSGEDIVALVDADWGQGDPVARASDIVRRYLEHWATHNALFRVRNLAADEGDMRFLTARADATMELLTSISDAVRRARDAGWVAAEIEPSATAGVLMATLERLAAVQFYYDSMAGQREQMIVSAGHMLAQMMGPPRIVA
nr:TetR/AcrR family transcriptional regulator [Sphingobium sp. Sx8-8]